jgi:CRP-like cAMP-binding protein
MLVLRLDAGPRAHTELVGEGDLIGPWVQTGEELAIPSDLKASVISPLRIALLDRPFAIRTAHWPEIHAALMRRLTLRARRLSLQATINAVPRIDTRLELTLWDLAYRFGRVTREGIAFDLPLTHVQLGDMVAAQRPSVTVGLGRLQAAGRAVRVGRHGWLLRGDPPALLSALARQSGVRG